MDKCLIYLIYCNAVCLYMKCSGLPRSVQFMRKLVGYNSTLDNNTIEVSTETSLFSCGRFCSKKNCTSYLYESTNNMCTVYSVYMIGNGQIVNNYYVNIGAMETVVVVSTCLSVEYNSSFTNVALHKQVTMSSRLTRLTDGSRLVDGVRDNSGFAVTKNESYPYMLVDLANNYNVHSLNVLNRLDCCGERLFNLTIELGETPDTTREYVYHEGVVGDECTFVLDHVVVARYVRLSVVGHTYLAICELGVYSLE